MPETGLYVKPIRVKVRAMIGVFDSGHGGLTVFEELVRRFPQRQFVYLGDHGNAPYGDRSHAEIVELTKAAADTLFRHGCRMVLMACNTATAIAGRTLQQNWLHQTWGHDHKLLGIIAPTVEAATQTPWHVVEPVFPQKFNTDTIALFATTATVDSGVFEEEIHKRCPRVRVAAKACPRLVPLLEAGASREQLRAAVAEYAAELLGGLEKAPEWAILGCTHYPLVEDIFRNILPPQTRVLGQPRVVANALEDYLSRRPEFGGNEGSAITPRYYTTGDVTEVRRVARILLGQDVPFEAIH